MKGAKKPKPKGPIRPDKAMVMGKKLTGKRKGC